MREPNSNCRDSSIFESKVGHSAYIHIQIHHIEVAQGNIFMEQIIRFGPVGSNEKKLGPIMSNF